MTGLSSQSQFHDEVDVVVVAIRKHVFGGHEVLLRTARTCKSHKVPEERWFHVGDTLHVNLDLNVRMEL